MPDQVERSADGSEAGIRFSPAAVARAQRTLKAEKPSELKLLLFSVIAGLMAGHLTKRQRPPSKAG
jgi:hypothetical protein